MAATEVTAATAASANSRWSWPDESFEYIARRRCYHTPVRFDPPVWEELPAEVDLPDTTPFGRSAVAWCLEQNIAKTRDVWVDLSDEMEPEYPNTIAGMLRETVKHGIKEVDDWSNTCFRFAGWQVVHGWKDMACSLSRWPVISGVLWSEHNEKQARKGRLVDYKRSPEGKILVWSGYEVHDGKLWLRAAGVDHKKWFLVNKQSFRAMFDNRWCVMEMLYGSEVDLIE